MALRSSFSNPNLGKTPQKTQSASDQIRGDFKQGTKFGKELVGDGSLGRLGGNTDLKSIINKKRELAKGLTSSETAGIRGNAEQQINSSTEQARRRLAALQARSGVRGATAGAQQSQIIGQGINRQQNLQRDLILRNRQAQQQGLNSLEGSVNSLERFDLGQQNKEKFAQLSTGLGLAGIGATERGSQAQAMAAQAAARNGGK